MSKKSRSEIADNAESTNEAARLVGLYFYYFATLEAQIDNSIRTLFNLDSLEGLIIVGNISFRDKIYILHTALDWQGKVHNEDWNRQARKAIARLIRLNRRRNIFAHSLFWPLENGRIEFSKVEAKGKLRLPSVSYSKRDFDCWYAMIDALYYELAEITKSLKNRQAVIEALARHAPNANSDELGSLDPLFRLAQAHPHLVPQSSNPKIDPQTPEDEAR